MKLKKTFSMLLLVMILMITGCGSENKEGTIAEEKNSFTFFHYKEQVVEGMDTLNAAFMEANSEIEVKQEMVATEYNTVLASKINVDNTPDIFMTGTTSYRSIKKYIDEGLIADLSGMEIIQSLPEEIVEPVRNEDGSVYVLPFTNTARGIIYNEQIFEEAGITELPETLSDLEEACKKIEAIGVTPFAVTGADGWTVGSIPWQVPQEIFSDREWIEARWNGEASFKDNGMDAFGFFDVMLAHCNENPMDTDFMTGVTGFVIGEYAMMAQGPWAIDTAIDLNEEVATWGRMMAMPVSENPDDTKLYIDNDMYLLISAEADIDLIDQYFMYIYNDEGRDIFANDVAVINAFGIDFESHQANMDILQYIHEDDIIANYQYNNMPDGFWQSNGKVMQEYIMGNVDKEQALEMLDNEWDSMTRE